MKMTCVRCPIGCKLVVKREGNDFVVEGNRCPRGEEFAIEEITDPKRILPTSVKVVGGNYPLVSVKTSKPIPRNRIFDVMEEIKKITVKAPVRIGDVIVENVLDLGADIIATRNVERV